MSLVVAESDLPGRGTRTFRPETVDGAARLEHDNEVSVHWSATSNGDDFSKNLIRARCEGRFATSVMRPLAVVKADLTA